MLKEDFLEGDNLNVERALKGDLTQPPEVA
jgi:hypothetical protein